MSDHGQGRGVTFYLMDESVQTFVLLYTCRHVKIVYNTVDMLRPLLLGTWPTNPNYLTGADPGGGGGPGGQDPPLLGDPQTS